MQASRSSQRFTQHKTGHYGRKHGTEDIYGETQGQTRQLMHNRFAVIITWLYASRRILDHTGAGKMQ